MPLMLRFSSVQALSCLLITYKAVLGFYTMSDHQENSEQYNLFVQFLMLAGIVVVGVFVIITQIDKWTDGKLDKWYQGLRSKEEKVDTRLAKDKQSHPSMKPTYTIYSGNCIRYRKSLVNGNKLKLTLIEQGFGKLVIASDRTSFIFYFNDELVYSGRDWDSSTDQSGGVGYTSDYRIDAHRSIAEKSLQVNYNPTGSNSDAYLGDRYEIERYQEN